MVATPNNPSLPGSPTPFGPIVSFSGSPKLRGGSVGRSRLLLIGVAALLTALLGHLWFAERTRSLSHLAPNVPKGAAQHSKRSYFLAPPDPRIVWPTLVAHNRDTEGVRIMFLGDSITEGGAVGTSHPRKHPNGSCSYRFSFLSHITETGPSTAASKAPHPGSKTSQVKLLPHQVRTVGPFSSNCGDTKVPDKCFRTLRESWGWETTQLSDALPSSIAYRQHAAVSGITALGLIRHREAWKKRDACYEKSGLLLTPPQLPPEVTSMDQAYRSKYPLRENTSDVAVWAAAYQPHLVIVLIGTNDFRWGNPWKQVLHESIPAIVHELTWFADARSSSLLKDAAPARSVATPSRSSSRSSINAATTAQQPGYVSASYASRKGEPRFECSTFVVVSTLLPRDDFDTDVEQFNAALLSIQRQRQLGNRVMCPKPDAFISEEHLLDGADSISGELFLLCHPCLRVVDGGAPVDENTHQRLRRSEFITNFMYDGLHPNDEGDDQLGRRLARQVMNL